jgi:hypothetical protein
VLAQKTLGKESQDTHKNKEDEVRWQDKTEINGPFGQFL